MLELPVFKSFLMIVPDKADVGCLAILGICLAVCQVLMATEFHS